MRAPGHVSEVCAFPGSASIHSSPYRSENASTRKRRPECPRHQGSHPKRGREPPTGSMTGSPYLLARDHRPPGYRRVAPASCPPPLLEASGSGVGDRSSTPWSRLQRSSGRPNACDLGPCALNIQASDTARRREEPSGHSTYDRKPRRAERHGLARVELAGVFPTHEAAAA